jgi:glycosyltransferase involved in cell wall biosynthesis
MADRLMRVTILIPALDEEAALPATMANVAALDPPPDEVMLVDGGSSDATVALADAAGFRTLVSARRGRSSQINLGVEQAAGDVVCVLHADTLLPIDAVAVIRATMADPKTVLASFTPRIAGPQGTRWGTTLHNWAKTWYAPFLFRPHLFIRRVRLLFGDHAMFFRKADFLRVGGCDPDCLVMEEADLCIRMAQIGHTRMVRRFVVTSDRRIAAWGPLKANYIYLKVGIMWAFGAKARMAQYYPDVR